MPTESKDQVVVATAPDGEIIAYGPMRRSEALVLVSEIESHEGWRAVMPLFGSAQMWPSSFEAKTGEKFEGTRGWKVHFEGES